MEETNPTVAAAEVVTAGSAEAEEEAEEEDATGDVLVKAVPEVE